MEPRFQHTEFLIGLAAIPLLVIVFLTVLRWKKKATSRIGDPLLVKELTGNHSPRRFAWKFVLIVLAFTAIVVAAANLQTKGAMDQVKRKGVDIMVVLDVSKSMLAEDIKPNRLERARQLVNKLMDQSQNDRIGLVVFAGRAYLQMPLTTDHAAARMFVQTAGPDVVPTQGTAIGEALKMANSAFNSKERKFKAVVLISDGEDHDPETLKLAKSLEQNGVMVNTVGIGSVEGAPIIDPVTNDFKKDAQGNNVISKLNEQGLRQLAQATRGVYVKLEDPAEAAAILGTQLAGIEQKALDDSTFVNYRSFFQWFVAVAMLLLLIELLLPERKTVYNENAL